MRITSYTKRILRQLAAQLYDRMPPTLRHLLPDSIWLRAGVLDGFIGLVVDKGITSLKVAAPNDGDASVLMLRMRWVPRHLAMETVLASELARRGVPVAFALCDQTLPACTGYDVRSHDRRREMCAYCARNNHAFASVSPFPTCHLAEFLEPADLQAAKRFASGVTADDLSDLTVDGLQLGNEFELTLAKYLFVSDVSVHPLTQSLAKEFAVSAYLLVVGLRRLLTKRRPSVVVMNAGQIMYYGVAYRLCKTMGIRTVTYDETNLSVVYLGWVFDDARPVLDFDWSKTWEERRSIVPSLDERSAVKQIIDTRRTYYLYEPDSKSRRLSTVFEPSRYRRVFALFTNIVWDCTVVGRNPVYGSHVDWLVETIAVLSQHPDCGLVVRIHPAEAGVYGMPSLERVLDGVASRVPTLPPNVTIITAEQRINSYELMDAADVVLAYASSVGMECALSGTPVVTVGDAYYRNKGFTLDPRSPAEYVELLDTLSNASELPEVDTELATKFAYLAFVDSQLDLGIFGEEHPFTVNTLRLTDLGKPLEGQASIGISRLADFVLATGPDLPLGPLLRDSPGDRA